MTKPRRSDPADIAKVDQLLAATAQQRDQTTLRETHPRKLVRNPCDDTSCPDCYGTEEEAEHVRRTGLMPGEGEPPVDRGARGAFTPPDRGGR
jgi:hypothetical protein